MPNHAGPKTFLILIAALNVLLHTNANAADPAAGKLVFNASCAICHSVIQGKNGLGPSLFDIVGRKAGQVKGFHYTAANQKVDLIWDEPTLDKYLQSPTALIPGTTMTVPGIKDDAKRADLIAYMATLK